MTAPASSSPVRWPWTTLVATAILAGGLLPVANWIRGGHEMPQYPVLVSEWTSGTLLIVGVGVILAVLGRRVPLWREGRLAPVVGAATRHPHRTAALLGLASFGVYAVVARTVFSARPLLIDEIAQVFQARIFAQGRTWVPVTDLPQLSSFMHVLDFDGRVYAQFPPGWPLLLSLGVLAGTPWLVAPACGALAAVAFWHAMRRIETRPGVALGASLVIAFSPMAVFMSASHMNHVGALLAVCAMLLGLAHATTGPAPRWAHAMVGVSIGVLATTRPVDAMAIGAPVIAWYAWRMFRGHVAAALTAGVAGLVPLAGLLWFNQRTTGDALLLGYSLLWGETHGLGFHQAPWGFAHTPARGIELVNLYLVRLQTYFLESSLPSLVPAALALALARRLSTFDRLLLASSAGVLIAYFAYWHDGFYLGPRFVYLLLPVLALWTARALPLLRERLGDGLPWRATAWSGVGMVAMTVAVGFPFRARQYANGMLSMRPSYAQLANAGGVRDAVILVRESWGAQLVARLWALGISRTETEGIYRVVDTCLLEQAVGRAEAAGLRGDAARGAILPLLADSARVVKSPLSPDDTERVLPGTSYPPRCVQRIAEDRAGFTHLAPAFVEDQGTNIYVRDLHEQGAPLLDRHAGRPFFLLKPSSSEIGAPLQLLRLSPDSLRAAWRRVD